MSGEDQYEREFMGGGTVLHRDKMVWRHRWLLYVPALATMLATVVTAGLASTGAEAVWVPFALAAGTLFFGSLSLLFAVIRSVVTTEHLHVQYGLWGPRIPIDAIESCEVTDYDWTEYGGWGIKYSGAGWAYTVWGQSQKVVKVSWRDGDTVKTAVFSAEDPVAVAKAVQRARGLAAMGHSEEEQLHSDEVRISGVQRISASTTTDPEAMAAVEALAEQEAEALEQAAEAEMVRDKDER